MKKVFAATSLIVGSIIGAGFAMKCTNLETVIIEEGAESIGDWAFANCPKLVFIVIPDSVTQIADDAFANSNFEMIIYGIQGSYAQDYAQRKNIEFKAISEISYDTLQATVDFVMIENGRKIYFDSQKVQYGSYATEIETPVKEGYTFYGWYDNRNCLGEPFDFKKTRIYGSLTLYPKFCLTVDDNMTPNFNTDVFSFANDGINFTLTGVYYEHLKEQATIFDIIAGRLEYATEPSPDGICFGMSSLMSLARTKKIDLSYYGVDCLAEIENPVNVSTSLSAGNAVDWNTSQLITYYHKLQKIGDIRKERLDYSDDEEKNIEELVEMTMSKKEPLVMGMDTLGKGEGGHAVVVYGCEKNSNGTYTIGMWDPNFPYDANKITVRSDMSEASVGLYGEKAFIKYTIAEGNTYNAYKLTDKLKAQGYVPTRARTSEATTYSTTYLTVNYDNFTVITADGKSATVKDREVYSGDTDIIEWLGSEGENGEQLYRLSPLSEDGGYVISVDSAANVESYDTIFENDTAETSGFGSIISMDEPGMITVDGAGNVYTKCAREVQQSVCSVRNDTKTEWMTARFSGKTEGLTVSNSNGKLTAKSLSACEITAELMDSYNTAKNTVSVEKNGTAIVSEQVAGKTTLSSSSVSRTLNMPYTAKFVTNTAVTAYTQTGLKTGDKIKEPLGINPGYKAL